MMKTRSGLKNNRANGMGICSFLISTWTIFLFVFVSTARADFHFHDWEPHVSRAKSLTLLPELSFYQSKENYNPTGQAVSLGTDTKYSRINGDVSATYGLSPELSLFGRISWSRVQAETATTVSNSYGLGDQSLGIHYAPFTFENGARIGFQGQLDIPAYSNDASQIRNTPYLGDQSLDATGGGFISLPISASGPKQWWLQGGAGFTGRTKKFSAGVPWMASLSYLPSYEGVYFDAGVYGVQSLKNDSSASTITPGQSVAGSYAYGAFNPSHIRAKAHAGYRIDPKTSLGATGAYTFWGQNAPKGMWVGIHAEFRFGENLSAGAQSEEDLMSPRKGFVQYSKEAKVIKVNDRLSLVKIDKGANDGIEVGQIFDIFSVRKDGAISEVVARGKVTDLKAHEAALTILEYFKEVWIEEGFIAKRPI